LVVMRMLFVCVCVMVFSFEMLQPCVSNPFGCVWVEQRMEAAAVVHLRTCGVSERPEAPTHRQPAAAEAGRAPAPL
jgi:hypothetical protein